MFRGYPVEILQKLDLFKGLTDDCLQEVARLCTESFIKKGDLCLSEGDRVNFVSFVRNGRVAVEIKIPESLHQDTLTVDILGENKLFAWSALMTHTLTASIRATEDTTILHINAAGLLSLCESKPQMGFIIMKNLNSTIHSRLVNTRRTLAATYKELGEYHSRELEESQQRLIQADKMSSLGQLAASIAHEVNNPIAGVLVYTQLLERKMTANTLNREQALDYLSKMKSELSRAGQLVRNLLDFARQTKPNLRLENLNDLINKVITMVAHSAELQRVKIVTNLSPDVPEVMADHNQLHQVLTNIMLNAIQAMPDGGIMSVRTVVDNGNNIKIDVQDTGIGISEENMQKLFTPFFTTKREAKGTGLGLAICQGIIKRHNGKLDVHSKEGQGSIFTVYLPLSQETIIM